MVDQPYRLGELLQKLKNVTRGIAHVFEAPTRKAGGIARVASDDIPGAGQMTDMDPGPGGSRGSAVTGRSAAARPSVRDLKRHAYELYDELAARLHEKWRAERLREAGGADRPPKTVEHDQEWIAEHGTDQVYLVRTAYHDLPFDYRRENYESAKVATDIVLDGHLAGRDTGTAEFMETAAERVHIAWLERNHEHAPADQRLPYDRLTEEEKEKDRVVVRAALELMQERLRGGTR
ncbi:hypothetical protein [Nocardia grenadensis]|uniref:hypothetical protein n=1 Tax=Nocardia grenadensis TaxID=931537 RepID=UPI003D7528FE